MWWLHNKRFCTLLQVCFPLALIMYSSASSVHGANQAFDDCHWDVLPYPTKDTLHVKVLNRSNVLGHVTRSSQEVPFFHTIIRIAFSSSVPISLCVWKTAFRHAAKSVELKPTASVPDGVFVYGVDLWLSDDLEIMSRLPATNSNIAYWSPVDEFLLSVLLQQIDLVGFNEGCTNSDILGDCLAVGKRDDSFILFHYMLINLLVRTKEPEKTGLKVYVAYF